MERKYIGKPFVKWVGGKSQLIPDLEKRLPSDFDKWDGAVYVEPFVGGGAMLFYMLQTFPNIECAYINDINEKLITTYNVIKKKPEKLLSRLEVLQKEYSPLDANERTEYYLYKRDEYNNRRLRDVSIASLLIFLNRTCFNGLYRVNSKGKFNVPHGRYVNPKICDEKTIMADSKLLQKVEISCGDFAKTMKYSLPNSLYYLDPPYKPITKTQAFTAYNEGGFDDKEQIRLYKFCTIIEKRGGSFILSNSDPKGTNPEDDFFDNLYGAFSINRVLASRAINSDGSKRGKLTELMISNF